MGLIPDKNRSMERKICPSVILITFVVIYADTSPAKVSTTGKDVLLPPPNELFNLDDLSNNLECTKNISPGYASRPGGLLSKRYISLYATACRERSSKIKKQ